MYQPDWDNPRTRNKVIRALGWVEVAFGETNRPRALARNWIDRQLGRSTDNLGRYLRTTLLKVVDDTWKWGGDHNHTKIWIRREDGYRHLLKQIGTVGPHPALQWITANLPVDQLVTGEFTYNIIGNRWYNPLQNIPKKYRDCLFSESGWTDDYDIDGCAQSLLLQHARHIGLTKSTPHMDQLVEDRTKLRDELARDLEIPPESVKTLLHAMLNGAPLGITNHRRRYVTWDLLECDISRISLIRGDVELEIPPHPILTGIRNDMRVMWSWINHHSPIRPNHISGRKLLRPTHKAAIYRQLEEVVINQVVELISHKLPFRIHDGFITKGVVDINEVTNHITKTTGFNIRLSHRSLSSTPSATRMGVVDSEASEFVTSLTGHSLSTSTKTTNTPSNQQTSDTSYNARHGNELSVTSTQLSVTSNTSTNYTHTHTIIVPHGNELSVTSKRGRPPKYQTEQERKTATREAARLRKQRQRGKL